MPLISREKSSLKGLWRLETVQDMRSSGSNPVSCSETSIKIYGSKEEIRARKSPETVDAPGFAPDASIPVILYVRRLQFGYFCFCHLKISMYYKERQSLLIVHFFRYIRSRILQQISYYLIELYCILWGDDRHI